jgi:hypothetical protein
MSRFTSSVNGFAYKQSYEGMFLFFHYIISCPLKTLYRTGNIWSDYFPPPRPTSSCHKDPKIECYFSYLRMCHLWVQNERYLCTVQ